MECLLCEEEMDPAPLKTENPQVEVFPIEKRETGEGLESCDKISEEFGDYSHDPLADSLLRETVYELEKALRESKRLLTQRDAEISALRSEIETVRRDSNGGTRECTSIEEEFKKSQIKIFELEKVIQQLQQDLTVCKKQTDKTATQSDECTVSSQACYCGSLCGAMKEAVELKRKLQLMEQKYHQLKRRFRHNERNRVKVAHRDSPCTIS